MIELKQSPKGLWFQMDPERPNIRFKSPDPKSTTPPALPPPAQTPSEIVPQAAKAGEIESRRLRKRTGRRATQITRGQLAGVPATTVQAGLKTKLGATA